MLIKLITLLVFFVNFQACKLGEMDGDILNKRSTPESTDDDDVGGVGGGGGG
ncbi:MAG: hypothetical protein HON90_07300, partial [Halobacteriovoraceae bacterium]|nr:hypothetical protein [Halobacteriovoraceae bacterium]